MELHDYLEIGWKIATVAFAAGGAFMAGKMSAAVLRTKIEGLEVRLKEGFEHVNQRIDDYLFRRQNT